jgi:hypothetical protein
MFKKAAVCNNTMETDYDIFDSIGELCDSTIKTQENAHKEIRQRVLDIYKPVIAACERTVRTRNNIIAGKLRQHITSKLQATEVEGEYQFNRYAMNKRNPDDPEEMWEPEVMVNNISMEAWDPYDCKSYSAAILQADVVFEVPSVVLRTTIHGTQPIAVTPDLLQEMFPELLSTRHMSDDYNSQDNNWFTANSTHVVVKFRLCKEYWEPYADDQYTRTPRMFIPR